MQLSSIGPTIMCSDLQKNVVTRRLGIFNLNIKITIVFEDASINQFIFGFSQAARGIHFYQIVIGERSLRIFVKHLHIGMARQAIEIVIKFLYIFAVVALVVGEAEKPFLQNCIVAIP